MHCITYDFESNLSDSCFCCKILQGPASLHLILEYYYLGRDFEDDKGEGASFFKSWSAVAALSNSMLSELERKTNLGVGLAIQESVLEITGEKEILLLCTIFRSEKT